MIRFFLIAAIIFSFDAAAQVQSGVKKNFAGLGAAFGSSQTSISASFEHNWHFGKKEKFFVGSGARFTSYFGSNTSYTSAPPKFAGDEKNTDSISVAKPSVNALNIFINLGYRISSKFTAGFNIDAAGFSFGSSRNAVFSGNGTVKPAIAKPTGGNILLVGNNDRGSLNSQLYLQYTLNKKWSIRAAYQYLFTEYSTTTKVQTVPAENDRFRNKASMIYTGVAIGF
jgi:long-subunit fatty acid transport protein